MSLTSLFLYSIRIFVIFLIVFGIFFGLYYFYRRRKEYYSLTEELQEVLINGKQTVKENKLKNFYTSKDGENILYVGKIISLVQVEENNPHDNTIYSIIAIRQRLFKPLKFYKLNSECHGNIFKDVVSNVWNFRLDDRSYYYIENMNKLQELEKIPTNRVGIDTIARVTPIVTHAIQINAKHRIRMREQKLIKEPTDLKPPQNQMVR